MEANSFPFRDNRKKRKRKKEKKSVECEGPQERSIPNIRENNGRDVERAMTKERDDTLPPIDPQAVLTHRFPQGEWSYTERDVALYALSVGACGKDACDPLELQYVYQLEGQSFIKVLPTFASLFSNLSGVLATIPGLNFQPSLLLHGEQYIEIYKPLPSRCRVKCESRISQLHDKGKASILEMENLCSDADTGESLYLTRMLFFLRGAGGFSASSQPFSYDSRKLSSSSQYKQPSAGFESPPFAVHEEKTLPNQALLYRLSGDYNPLHSDPDIAGMAGFSRPILHGLCSLGFAVRAVIKHCCLGDPTLIGSVQCRFLLHVYPGETLVTEMWRDSSKTRVQFQCQVKERGKRVLTGVVTLHPSSRL